MLKVFAIVGIVLFCLFCAVLAWACCAAAGNADRIEYEQQAHMRAKVDAGTAVGGDA